jgi:hypothetical protein
MHAHRLLLVAAVAASWACAQREWRPAFDARCDCDSADPATAAHTTTAPSVATHTPGTAGHFTIFDYLRDHGVKDPVKLAYPSESEFYKGPVHQILVGHYEEAKAAAEAAAESVARDLSTELGVLRREVRLLKKTGDADGVAASKLQLWLRFEAGFAVLHEEASIAGRQRIPVPSDPILFTCHFEAASATSSGPKAAAGDVCDVLMDVDLERFRRARDAFVEEIVAPILLEQRRRLVIVMNQ